MKANRATWRWPICGAARAALAVLPSVALAQSEADLAKQSQNPVADLISVPFQNNTFFGVGPDDDVANVLKIQPVIPINFGPVKLISRTIVPLIYLPDVTAGLAELPEGISGGSTFALATSTTRAGCRRSPAGRSPSASAPRSAFRPPRTRSSAPRSGAPAPSAVALVTPSPSVVGTLIRQIWSFAGDDGRQDVSQLLIQPFVNYNLPDGWSWCRHRSSRPTGRPTPIINGWCRSGAVAPAACSDPVHSRSMSACRPTTTSRNHSSAPTGRSASRSRSCSRSERRRPRRGIVDGSPCAS
jgi:hypothetical protein